ncbi:hypothetical protein Dsin_023274 [Dipteronia sinensis]|uniref:Uncharacterized protein n=1 Tax=Dipteronia sinensis TaxID=43782 RepID=A0AAE0A455_9ROSI|nr:hypothetical protein Dsin_023274 [Dipteronia sinensis]
MGHFQDSNEGMARVIQDYFESIFRTTDPSPQDTRKATDAIKSRLSDDKREDLNVAFTAEVRAAVFDLSPTKALGPDGFQAIFFQRF